MCLVWPNWIVKISGRGFVRQTIRGHGWPLRRFCTICAKQDWVYGKIEADFGGKPIIAPTNTENNAIRGGCNKSPRLFRRYILKGHLSCIHTVELSNLQSVTNAPGSEANTRTAEPTIGNTAGHTWEHQYGVRVCVTFFLLNQQVSRSLVNNQDGVW